MIVAALADYYRRLESDPESGVPVFGWSEQKIGFVVLLEADGSLHGVEPPPTSDASAARRFTLTVPGQSKPPGSGVNPCFLWDNSAYALGVVPEGRTQDWAWRRFEGFRLEHFQLEDEIDDPAFRAVCSFLRAWSRESFEVHVELNEVAAGFGVFRLRGEREYVHQRRAVVDYWNRRVEATQSDSVEGVSLVSGLRQPLALVHEPKIKRVQGSQSSGALLTSFNCKAYESYHKEQGLNAPVGRREAFRYCTALNALLSDEHRRVQVGDATTVFWSEKPHPFEDITGAIVAGREDEGTLRRVEAFLDSLRRGTPDDIVDDADTRFFVLGLSPNAARVAVRFWIQGSVGEFAKRLARHASALELDGAPQGYAFPSIRRLVEETAPLKSSGWPDSERVSPVLAGEVARAILGGTSLSAFTSRSNDPTPPCGRVRESRQAQAGAPGDASPGLDPQGLPDTRQAGHDEGDSHDAERRRSRCFLPARTPLRGLREDAGRGLRRCAQRIDPRPVPGRCLGESIDRVSAPVASARPPPPEARASGPPHQPRAARF